MGQVDGGGEAGRVDEEVRVTSGVVHRPAAAHREARDRPAPPRGDRPVVLVDPGDQLADVVGLPRRRAEAAAVVPVDIAVGGAAVGHDDNQVVVRDDFLERALVAPER